MGCAAVRKWDLRNWETDVISDIEATGKDEGVRVDDRCFNLADCRTYRCTAVAAATSTWVVCAGSLPISTGSRTVIVADGSGDWVEEGDVTISATGLITTTGGLCLDESDICFSDSGGIERATLGLNGDDWEITAFDSLGVETATLSIDTANGTADFDGVITVDGLVIGGTDASDAHVDADDFVVGTLSTQDAGMSVLVEPTTGQGWLAFTDVSTVMAADLHWDAASGELRSRVAGTQWLSATASAVGIVPDTTLSGDLTLNSAAPTLTMGDNTGNPTIQMQTSAAGTAALYMGDGTNAQDGGVGYYAASDAVFLRAANADQIYLVDTALYPSTDNDLQLGLTIRRWTTVNSYAGDFATNVGVTGTLTASGLTYPTSDGGSGDIMSTNGAGTLSLVTLASLGLPDAGTTNDATLRWDAVGTQWLENTALLATSAGAVTASGNLTLDSASPVLQLGDGTGNPTVQIVGSATGFPAVFFQDVGQALQWDEAAQILRQYIAGNAEVTLNASTLTLPTNDLTLSAGDLTVTAGDATIGGTLLLSHATNPQLHFIDSGNRIFVNGGAMQFFLGGSREMYFDSSAMYLESNDLTLTTGDLTVTAGAGTIGGTFTASGLTYPTSDGGSGDIMYTDGAGNLSLVSLAYLGLPGYGSTDNATLRWDSGNAQWEENTALLATSAGAVTASGNLTLDADSAILNVGSGTGTAANPNIWIRSDGAGNSALYFVKGTSFGAGDFFIGQTQIEDLRVYYHDGTAQRLTQSWYNDASIAMMEDAQSSASLTLGSTSFGAGESAKVFLRGNNTGLPGIQFYDANTALMYYNAGQYLESYVSGTKTMQMETGEVNFYQDLLLDSASPTLTVGDGSVSASSGTILIGGGATSNPTAQFIDGGNTITFRESIQDFSSLVGGVEFMVWGQGSRVYLMPDSSITSPLVSVGNSSSMAATDEAYMVLYGGTSGAPAYRFIDSGNYLEFLELGQYYQLAIGGTANYVFAPTVLRPTAAAKDLGGGAASTETWSVFYQEDGVSAPSTPTGGIAQYKDSSDSLVKIKHSSGNVSTIAHDADSQVVAVHERATTDLARSNTTSESSYFAYSIPAGALGANGVLNAVFVGDLVNGVGDGSPLTVTIIIKLGTTVLFEDDTLTFDDVAATSPRIPFTIKAWMANQNSESDQIGGAEVIFGKGSSATTGFGNLASASGEIVQSVSFTDGAEDTSSAKTFDIRMTMDVASTSTIIRRRMAYLTISKEA